MTESRFQLCILSLISLTIAALTGWWVAGIGGMKLGLAIGLMMIMTGATIHYALKNVKEI